MIIHILKNGKQVDDIAGHPVELNEKTQKAYELIEEIGKIKIELQEERA